MYSNLFALISLIAIVIGLWAWYYVSKKLPAGSTTVWERPAPAYSAPAFTELDGTVKHVSDGDGFEFLCDGSVAPIRIRIAGIDAPETAQDFGKKAKRILAKKIGGQRVHITIIGTDQYGRNLSYVSLDGKDVGMFMIASGAAWAFVNFPNIPDSIQSLYESCEADARQSHLGLWADENPQAPWDWRRENEGWDGDRDGTHYEPNAHSRPVQPASFTNDDLPYKNNEPEVVMPSPAFSASSTMVVDAEGHISPAVDPLSEQSTNCETETQISSDPTSSFIAEPCVAATGNF